ncbi:MAG: thioredoxin domain-containing protein [Candidatus Sulfopaludibacter sp.]|nr:thioredoxin domain-containing protein [Candidatus Sulfopaludibacter sp.]
MAKKETNVSQWVDERIAALDAGDWLPDSVQGQARFRDRRRAARRHQIEWIMAAIASTAACAALMIFSSPGACARPNGCASDQPRPAVTAPVRTPPPAVVNFKESGSPTAPVVCEIYTDYECPHCAIFYRETVPLLMDRYVRTGRVRLVHRDFPLQRNQYSRLAARYANAAGIIGQYDPVVNRIFQTQELWKRDGNVDAQVMLVLPPGAMQRVRDLVANDPHLDDSLTADMGMAAGDRVDRTPFIVIVAGGRRQALGSPPQFSILRTYLDQLLAGR